MEDRYLREQESYLRLVREYEKHGGLVIGFDFDDTVHDYHNGGKDKYPKLITLLRDLKKIGCTLICWTAHMNHDYVNNYLYEHKIPFDGINTDGVKLDWETRKPFFNALLDDRAGLAQVYEELTALVEYIKHKKNNESSVTN
jgi:hypothetical protein